MSQSHPPASAPRLLRLDPRDNVAVAVTTLEPGEAIILDGQDVTPAEPIPAGHKLATVAIAAGQPVIKYGLPIGVATCDIGAGRHVHAHNCRSAIS